MHLSPKTRSFFPLPSLGFLHTNRLATMLQTPKSFLWDLQQCCKRQKIFRGTCNNVANAKKIFAGLATVLQTPESFSWDLQRCCKRQKVFGCYSALSKTFSRDKGPHSFVELTYFQLSVGPVGSIVLHRQGLSACKTSISKKQGLLGQAYTEATSQKEGPTNTSKSHDMQPRQSPEKTWCIFFSTRCHIFAPSCVKGDV